MHHHHAVTRWDPFAGMLTLEDEVRDLFRDFYRDAGAGWGGKGRDGGSWSPAVDIEETDQAYIVTADLPGVDQKDVKVSVENQALRIFGERKSESKETDQAYIVTADLPGVDQKDVKVSVTMYAW